MFHIQTIVACFIYYECNYYFLPVFPFVLRVKKDSTEE